MAKRSTSTRVLIWGGSIGGLLLLCYVILVFALPPVITDVAEEYLREQGFESATIEVTAITPSHLRAADFRLEQGPLCIEADEIDIDYAIPQLFRDQRLQSVILSGLSVYVRDPKFSPSSGDSADMSTLQVPATVLEPPSDKFLIQSGHLLVCLGKDVRHWSINALFERLNPSAISLSATLLSNAGEGLDISGELEDGAGTLRAEGQIRPDQWAPLIANIAGAAIPHPLKIQSGVLGIEILGQFDDNSLTRWASTLQLPFVEVEDDTWSIMAEDLRAGITGNNLEVKRLSAEGKLGGRYQQLSVDPSEVSVGILQHGKATISAPHITFHPDQGPDADQGTASIEGTLELEDIWKGDAEVTDSDIELNLEFPGQFSAPNYSVDVSGVSAKLHITGSPSNLQVATISPLRVERVQVGELEFTSLLARLRLEGEHLEVPELTGNLLGGRIVLEDLSGTVEDFEFNIRIESISSAEVVKLIPQLKGTALNGPFDGSLHGAWDHGVLSIYPSELHLKKGKTAYFASSDAADLLAGEDQNFVMKRVIRSLSSMNAREVKISLAKDPQTPMQLHLMGDGTKKNTAPVDLNLTINGDVAYVLKLLLGDSFEVRFVPNPTNETSRSPEGSDSR